MDKIQDSGASRLDHVLTASFLLGVVSLVITALVLLFHETLILESLMALMSIVALVAIFLMQCVQGITFPVTLLALWYIVWLVPKTMVVRFLDQEYAAGALLAATSAVALFPLVCFAATLINACKQSNKETTTTC